MHLRNRHQGSYDFERLCQACPELTAMLRQNPKGESTIDFSDPKAVFILNQAILYADYGILFWQLPPDALCPPIPGRADYIHYLADLIGEDSSRKRILDVGTGANCIYPIIGCQTYGWKFVGTDIDRSSLKSARAIVELNPSLRNRVRLVRQQQVDSIFHGVIQPKDQFTATMCNPPFHDSAEAAEAGSRRKWRNLGRPAKGELGPNLNFGGQATELWCPGGELGFISRMIEESTDYAEQVGWFTTLVSKSRNLPALRQVLRRVSATTVKVISMQQGQKESRLLAWRF